MPSKTSYSKCVFSKAVIKKDLIHLLPAWLFYLAALCVIYPISNLFSLASIREGYGYLPEEIPGAKAMTEVWVLEDSFRPIPIAIAALAAAMLLFYYLHFAKSSNMVHAYPLTRTQLFASHALAGALMLIIPVLVTGFMNMGVAMSVDPRFIGPAAFWILWAVVASLLFYSLALLCCMVTGIILTVPVFYLILMYLVDGLRYLWLSLAEVLNYGCGSAAAVVGMDAIWAPLGHLQWKTGITIETGIDRVLWEKGVQYSETGSLIIYLITAAILIVIAWRIYLVRRIEDVGKIITVRWLRPVFQWGVTFVGAAFLVIFLVVNLGNSALLITPKNAFAVVIFTFLGFAFGIWYLLEVVMSRKWKTMTRRKWAEALSCFAVYAVMIVLMECDAFGMERHVPKTDQVAAVDFQCTREIVLTDPSEIEEFLRFHQELIAEKKPVEASLSKYYEQAAWTTLEYHMKDGSELHRSYCVPWTEETTGLPSMAMLDRINDNESYFLRSAFCVNYPQMELTGGGIELYDMEKYEENGEYDSFYLTFTQDEAEQLFDAYMQDFREGNLTEHYTKMPEEEVYYMSNLVINFRIPGGRPIDQYEILYSEEEINPVGRSAYTLLDTMEYESAEGETEAVHSSWLTLTERCRHTIRMLEKLGCFEGGYGLVP